MKSLQSIFRFLIIAVKWAGFLYSQWHKYLYIALVGIAIVLRPYWNTGKFLALDATYYLKYAGLVGDGTFFSDFFTGRMEFFGVWPIGYPLLTGLCSLLTGGDVFLAGRLVQLLFFLMVVRVVRDFYPKDWFFYICLIGTGSFLSMFFQTMSDAGFVALGFLLLWVVMKNDNKLNLLLVFCLMLVIFLFRYIGVFLFLFFVFYYFIIKKNNNYLFLLIPFLIFIYFYFYHVYQATDHFSGIHRTGSGASRWELIGLYIKALLAKLSYFDIAHYGGKAGKVLFWTGLLPMTGILGFALYQKKFPFSKGKTNERQKTFLLYGISYLLTYGFTLVILGWDHDGWGVDGRFIAPGFTFILVALMDYYRPSQGFPLVLKNLFSLSAMVVIIYYGYIQAVLDGFR